MPKQYPPEAWKLCRDLYCKYGGINHDLIERDMRRAGYVGWQKSILYDKGKDKNARMGWISRHGFERSLDKYTQKLVEQVNTDEQELYLDVRTRRKELSELVRGKDATKDDKYLHRDYCKLEIEARKALDLSQDNFETYVSGFEKTLSWLAEIDPQAAKVVIKHTDKLTDMAKAHYGKTETDDGVSSRSNEGRSSEDGGQAVKR